MANKCTADRTSNRADRSSLIEVGNASRFESRTLAAIAYRTIDQTRRVARLAGMSLRGSCVLFRLVGMLLLPVVVVLASTTSGGKLTFSHGPPSTCQSRDRAIYHVT